MSGWSLRVAAALEEPSAPRVVTSEGLARLVEAERGEASGQTLWRLSRDLEAAGFLEKASRGVWINARAFPAARLEEALGIARRGAVASLHSVLGDCGFLNNPSRTATGVVPLGAGEPARSTGSWTSKAGARFHVWSMPREAMEIGREWLDASVPYARAIPERALCDWLLIAARGKAGLPPPPADVDGDELDRGLAREIARAYGIERELDAFADRVRKESGEDAWEPELAEGLSRRAPGMR